MLEFVTAECTEIGYVIRRNRTVHIHHPLSNVSSHIVKTEIVRRVEANLHGNISLVIQPTRGTHVITAATFVVRKDLATLLCIRITCSVTVPRVFVLIYNSVVNTFTSISICCIFPFCFSWKAVLWKYNTILDTSWTAFFTVNASWVKIFKTFLVLLHVFTLLVQVHFSVEVVSIHLIRHLLQNTLVDQNSFVHTIRSPR